MAAISACRVTSAANALALPPSATISAATALASVSWRDTTSRLQPATPKRRAIPRPIPLLEPVTMTLRPLSEVNIADLLTCGTLQSEIGRAEALARVSLCHGCEPRQTDGRTELRYGMPATRSAKYAAKRQR